MEYAHDGDPWFRSACRSKAVVASGTNRLDPVTTIDPKAIYVLARQPDCLYDSNG